MQQVENSLPPRLTTCISPFQRVGARALLGRSRRRYCGNGDGIDDYLGRVLSEHYSLIVVERCPALRGSMAFVRHAGCTTLSVAGIRQIQDYSLRTRTLRRVGRPKAMTHKPLLFKWTTIRIRPSTGESSNKEKDE